MRLHLSLKFAAALAVCLLLALLAGCSTDDDVGGFTPSCLTLIPEKEPTPGEVVMVWGLESTCDTLELELAVSGVDSVWAASFEVVYPDGIVQFVALDAGDSFLRGANGTDDLIVEAQEILPGRVEIGLTRVDSQNNAGVAPTDENTLLVRMFIYRIASSGSGDVTLEDFELTKVEAPGDVPAPFDPPVPVFGGELLIEN